MDYLKMLDKLEAEYPEAADAVDELKGFLDADAAEEEELPMDEEAELPMDMEDEEPLDDEIDDIIGMG